jgi:hypothetical protein
MFRKNDSILFNEQLKWLVDVEWYYRLIINKINFAYLPKTLIGTHHAFEGQTTQEVQKLKAIQIKEHVLMFQSIYHSITNFSVFNLYFEILFNKYGIKNWEELTSIITPDKEFNKYFKDRIYKSNSFIFFKKILFWYKKRGAKVIFEYFKSKLK